MDERAANGSLGVAGSLGRLPRVHLRTRGQSSRRNGRTQTQEARDTGHRRPRGSRQWPVLATGPANSPSRQVCLVVVIGDGK